MNAWSGMTLKEWDAWWERLAHLIATAQLVHHNLDEHNGFATCRATLKHELGKALEPFQETT